MAVSLLKGLTKIGIATGAVYVTLDQGIWRGPQEGANSLSRLTHTIPSQDRIVKQMPSTENVTTSMKQTWNSGVQKAFAGLATTPDKMSQLTSSATNYLKDSVKSAGDK